jgi:methionyl-tRNA formyltransferase
MRIVVVTSQPRALASYALPFLADSRQIEIAGVIWNRPGRTPIPARIAGYRTKLRKARRIGIIGALNGIRIRRWFDFDAHGGGRIPHIAHLCRNLEVPLVEVRSLTAQATADAIRKLGSDLGISLGNPYIGRKVFEAPRQGMINIHHELLPDYRGASSVIWQIFNGSATTGFTIHRINDRIDAGEILLRQEHSIAFGPSLRETVVATLAEVYPASIAALLTVLENYRQHEEAAAPQGLGKNYTTPTLRQFLRMVHLHEQMRSTKGREAGKLATTPAG